VSRATHRTLGSRLSEIRGDRASPALSGIAGTPALPNVDGSGSVAEASRQACEERQL
jgi:hypothetical protein